MSSALQEGLGMVGQAVAADQRGELQTAFDLYDRSINLFEHALQGIKL